MPSVTLTPADITDVTTGFTFGPSDSNFVTTDNGSTTFGDVDISGTGSDTGPGGAHVDTQSTFRQSGTLDLSSVPNGALISFVRINVPSTLTVAVAADGTSINEAQYDIDLGGIAETGSDVDTGPVSAGGSFTNTGTDADINFDFTSSPIDKTALAAMFAAIVLEFEILLVADAPTGGAATASGSFAAAITGWEMEVTYAVDTISITEVIPAVGGLAGGDVVEVIGTNFDPLVEVVFDHLFALAVVWNSDTSLTVTTPPHAEGAVTVTVTNPTGGEFAEGVGLFEYADADSPLGEPFITSVVPSSGTMAGGTAVTITGGGFKQGSIVLFDDSPATAVVVSPDGTQITCVTPAHQVEAVDVKVLS